MRRAESASCAWNVTTVESVLKGFACDVTPVMSGGSEFGTPEASRHPVVESAAMPQQIHTRTGLSDVVSTQADRPWR
jgi:hypothetical protein